MNKWIELNIILKDTNRTNEVLTTFIKPYIKALYFCNIIFHWHFFREPSICWRIMADEYILDSIKTELDYELKHKEYEHPDLYSKHYFGAFLQEGKEYTGEQELYGEDSWELCYKRWESGSNLALLLCTTNPTKSLPFHYTRDIHLFENQLGLELSDAITIYLKWIKRLMECDTQYSPYIQEVESLIANTLRPSIIEGI